MDKGVVIIGTGHAGVQAAASLREEGFDGRVTLVGDEPDLPYHKPPLSKTFIKDAAAKPQILRADAFYTGANIELLLGERVERLDPATGRLVLASGRTLPFDGAVLATGARPRLLPAGAGIDGVVSLRSIADARIIRDLSAAAEDVVVIGGGFIGLEIAATLAAGGRRVTVVEAQDRLLARAVAPALAAHVGRRLAEAGVRILTGTTVAGLESEAGRLAAVVTSTGERIAARLAVVGIGVVANDELARAAGIDVADGVRIDASMRTSAPNVFAIGDVARYRHWMTGGDVRLESVQNATDQARLLAKTVVGRGETYAAVPWFWSDIGDMKLQMVGLTAGTARQVLSGDPAESRFSVYHYDDGGRLLGIESVNRPADHMLGRRMMGEGFLPGEAVTARGADAVKAAYEAWRAAKS